MNIHKKATRSNLKYWQNFYHLSSIQTVSLGIPVIIIGKQLSELHGVGTAICSILIGNLILWIIGLAITSMAYQDQTNAIENIKGYIGRFGSFLFALILILAFLDWYVVQINYTAKGIYTLFGWNNASIIRIGATLGILSALLAIGGIRLLKWMTAIGFPFVLIYNIYIVITSDYSIFPKWEWGISFSAMIATILVLLPGIINLPTFFRHSRSKADSFLALTFMVIFYTFFECATIWMNFSTGSTFILATPTAMLGYVIPTALFLVLTSTCSNLLNIYLASACYETFIPKFAGTKGHAIMGLMGTAAYTFIQISSPVQFLENLLNCFIGVIGIVLFIGVLARIIIRHRLRTFERTINIIAWLIGCIVATMLIIQNPDQVVRPLLLSMGASTLFFLFVFFIEETYWSLQKIRSGRRIGGNIE
jgi:cytosine permease